MPLTPDDLKKITEIVDRRQPPHQDFFIDPETHYKQHARMDRLLDALEKAEKGFWSWFLGVILLGLCVFAVAAIKFKGLFS